MNESANRAEKAGAEAPKKPCIALMGEFSSGKSTLANLLIGHAPLPVQVIATQLPPVRITYGDGAPFQVTLEGERSTIDLTDLDRTAFEEVAYLQIYSQEDILKHCDLLDMPGISDPNMPADVWGRMIGEADGVLWCSSATQAWRQSEAAVWKTLSPQISERSLLLITRIDKLTSPADRDRVIARVRQETAGLFRDVLPVSLLLATRERDDMTLWQESGAEQLAESLISILVDINAASGASDLTGLRLPAFQQPQAPAPGIEDLDDFAQRVVPRRPVVRKGRTARPASPG